MLAPMMRDTYWLYEAVTRWRPLPLTSKIAVRRGLIAESFEATVPLASTASFLSYRAPTLKLQCWLRSHLSLTKADCVCCLSCDPLMKIGVERMIGFDGLNCG